MNLPAEFETEVKSILGEEFPLFLVCYGMERMQGIRINRQKISAEEFLKITPFHLRPIPWTDNGFFYDREEEVTKHPHYYAGLYYVQEPSAMVPASRLPIEPGDRVLDLCAAPGGKATELGARLRGTGILAANDISPSRAGALVKNLELAGIPNVLVTAETPERLRARYGEHFDKILVDAPCSGEGMFRKDPALIKSWIERGPEYYAPLQEEILLNAAGMLRPGGMILYSTCTFSVAENERVVARVLKQCPQMELAEPLWYEGFSPGCRGRMGDELVSAREYPEFDPEKCIRIWPHRMEGEGHFAALLRKAGPDRRHEMKEETGGENLLSPGQLRELPEEAAAFLEKIRLPFSVSGWKAERVKDSLLLIPEGMAYKGLRCLRTGLLLGTVKKKRFEPSQALAMALKMDSWDNFIDFSRDDYRAERYLKGETLDPGETDEGKRSSGWTLVGCDGFPLGWGKMVNGQLRNKYQAGWRKMS